jgi:glucose-1-phosphate thymidylyltransferase
VAEINEERLIKRLIEKPQTKENNLAVVGCYYFKSSEDLMAAIEEQMRRNVQLKNEYFLVDAINILIERGALMRVEQVDTWLDTGTIDATLETNAFLLKRMDVKPEERPDVKVLPPVFIHPTAEVSEAVIGPNVSIGPNCKINQVVIQDSIIEEGTQITNAALTHSLIGRDCVVEGQPNQEEASSLNIGDNSNVRFEA